MFNPHVRETPKSNLAWHCITIPLVETILNPYFCWSRMVTRLLILAFPHVFPSLDHLSPLYKFPSLDQNHLFPPIFTGKGEKRKKVETCPPQKKIKKHFFPPQSQALMASALPAPSSGSPRLQRSAHARVPWPGRGRLFQSPVPEEGWKILKIPMKNGTWAWLILVYGCLWHWTIGQKLTFDSDIFRCSTVLALFCWRCNKRVSLFHCFGESQMIFWGLT